MGCLGRCKPKRSDGDAAHICGLAGCVPGKPQWGKYDYYSCKAGDGTCGTCGSTAPVGGWCSVNSDCTSDSWCRGGNALLCNGKCERKRADGVNAYICGLAGCVPGKPQWD